MYVQAVAEDVTAGVRGGRPQSLGARLVPGHTGHGLHLDSRNILCQLYDLRQWKSKLNVNNIKADLYFNECEMRSLEKF